MKKLILLTVLPFVTNGQISFAPSITFPQESKFLATGDFNTDGLADIVTITDTVNYNLFVYLQNQSGKMNEPLLLEYTPIKTGALSITSGDITNDGFDGIFFGVGNTMWTIFQDLANGGFTHPFYGRMGGDNVRVDDIAIKDLDQNGANDIIVMSRGEYLVAFYSDGTGRFFSEYYFEIIGHEYSNFEISKVASESLNSIISFDAKDLLLIIARIHQNKYMSGVVQLDLNKPKSNAFCIGNFWNAGNCVATAYNHSQIAIWKNPYVSQVPDTILEIDETPQVMCSADFDRDGRDELLALHGGRNKFTIISFKDHGIEIYKFGVSLPDFAPSNSLIVGDFNHDNKIDFSFTNIHVGLTILLNTSITTSNANAEISDVKLFPNPCLDFLNLENLKQGEDITITNGFGKVIKKVISQNQKVKIDVSEINPGIYFVKLSNKTFKFIKI